MTNIGPSYSTGSRFVLNQDGIDTQQASLTSPNEQAAVTGSPRFSEQDAVEISLEAIALAQRQDSVLQDTDVAHPSPEDTNPSRGDFEKQGPTQFVGLPNSPPPDPGPD